MQTNLTFVIRKPIFKLKRTRACVAVLTIKIFNCLKLVSTLSTIQNCLIYTFVPWCISLRDSIPSFTFLCLKLHSLVTILVFFQSTSLKQFTLCRANLPSSFPIRSLAAATLPFSISSFVSLTCFHVPFFLSSTISTFLQHIHCFLTFAWNLVYNTLLLLTEWFSLSSSHEESDEILEHLNNQTGSYCVHQRRSKR